MTLLHAITIGCSCGTAIAFWMILIGVCLRKDTRTKEQERRDEMLVLMEAHQRRATSLENTEDHLRRIAEALERPYLPKQ